MACKEWLGQLDRYLDGELATVEARNFAAHIRECPVCTGELLERVRIKRSIQLAGKRYVPSAELRSKIAKNLEAKSLPRIRRRWSFILTPAFVLVLAAFLLNSRITGERVAQHRVYSELSDLHVTTLASSTPVDVLSSDRHTVKPWFQGKIPFTFNLPELAGSQFSLVGGRVFYLDQVSGAHLIYQVRKHEISAFILPDRAEEIKRLSSGTSSTLSFQTESWTQNGLRYFLIGDASADDIRALSKLLRDAG